MTRPGDSGWLHGRGKKRIWAVLRSQNPIAVRSILARFAGVVDNNNHLVVGPSSLAFLHKVCFEQDKPLAVAVAVVAAETSVMGRYNRPCHSVRGQPFLM